jgi:chromate transport protein ChrA
LLAITLPPLLVLVVAGIYHRFGQRDWIAPAMRGISLGVVGIQLSISWTILLSSGSNWRGWLIGGGASVLALNKRVNVLVILALAGLAGYLALR